MKFLKLKNYSLQGCKNSKLIKLKGVFYTTIKRRNKTKSNEKVSLTKIIECRTNSKRFRFKNVILRLSSANTPKNEVYLSISVIPFTAVLPSFLSFLYFVRKRILIRSGEIRCDPPFEDQLNGVGIILSLVYSFTLVLNLSNNLNLTNVRVPYLTLIIKCFPPVLICIAFTGFLIESLNSTGPFKEKRKVFKVLPSWVFEFILLICLTLTNLESTVPENDLRVSEDIRLFQSAKTIIHRLATISALERMEGTETKNQVLNSIENCYKNLLIGKDSHRMIEGGQPFIDEIKLAIKENRPVNWKLGMSNYLMKKYEIVKNSRFTDIPMHEQENLFTPSIPYGGFQNAGNFLTEMPNCSFLDFLLFNGIPMPDALLIMEMSKLQKIKQLDFLKPIDISKDKIILKPKTTVQRNTKKKRVHRLRDLGDLDEFNYLLKENNNSSDKNFSDKAN